LAAQPTDRIGNSLSLSLSLSLSPPKAHEEEQEVEAMGGATGVGNDEKTVVIVGMMVLIKMVALAMISLHGAGAST
jgi:hypothetical protein